MKLPARTPGPWRTVDFLVRAEEIHGPKSEVLVMRQDNAKLGDMLAMAAAPDLLDALTYALKDMEQLRDSEAGSRLAVSIGMARAAIAKATGANA